jgi:hypothetical protein
MFSEVLENVQGFSSHNFMLYEFVVSDDNEVMRNFLWKCFCLCQKLFVCLNLLKRKILCGLKENKDSEQKKHIYRKLIDDNDVQSPTQIYV